MVNSIEDIKKFISDNSFKRIFILCGKKSFITSGAEEFFKKNVNKNTKVIIVIHMQGLCVDYLDKLKKFCLKKIFLDGVLTDSQAI